MQIHLKSNLFWIFSSCNTQYQLKQSASSAAIVRPPLNVSTDAMSLDGILDSISCGSISSPPSPANYLSKYKFLPLAHSHFARNRSQRMRLIKRKMSIEPVVRQFNYLKILHNYFLLCGIEPLVSFKWIFFKQNAIFQHLLHSSFVSPAIWHKSLLNQFQRRNKSKKERRKINRDAMKCIWKDENNNSLRNSWENLGQA